MFSHLRRIGRYFRQCAIRSSILLEKVWTSFVFLNLTDMAKKVYVGFHDGG